MSIDKKTLQYIIDTGRAAKPQHLGGGGENMVYMTPEMYAAVEGVLRAEQNLPCPLCLGVEGCDHTVPERERAAIDKKWPLRVGETVHDAKYPDMTEGEVLRVVYGDDGVTYDVRWKTTGIEKNYIRKSLLTQQEKSLNVSGAESHIKQLREQAAIFRNVDQGENGAAGLEAAANWIERAAKQIIGEENENGIHQIQWHNNKHWVDVPREEYIAKMNSSEAEDIRFRIVHQNSLDRHEVVEAAYQVCMELSQKYGLEGTDALQSAAGILRTRLKKGSLEAALDFIEKLPDYEPEVVTEEAPQDAMYREFAKGAIAAGALALEPKGEAIDREYHADRTLDSAVKVFEEAACHETYKLREGVAAVIKHILKTNREVIEKLTEPVSIQKAMLAGESAKVVTALGGKQHAVFLVNMQLTSWACTEQFNAGYEAGFNRAAKLMQEALTANQRPTSQDLINLELDEMWRKATKAQHERDVFRAVLEGMEFNELDELPTKGIGFAQQVGEKAKRVTLELIKSVKDVAALKDRIVCPDKPYTSRLSEVSNDNLDLRIYEVVRKHAQRSLSTMVWSIENHKLFILMREFLNEEIRLKEKLDAQRLIGVLNIAQRQD